MVAKIKRTLCIEYMFEKELRKIYVHAFAQPFPVQSVVKCIFNMLSNIYVSIDTELYTLRTQISK